MDDGFLPIWDKNQHTNINNSYCRFLKCFNWVGVALILAKCLYAHLNSQHVETYPGPEKMVCKQLLVSPAQVAPKTSGWTWAVATGTANHSRKRGADTNYLQNGERMWGQSSGHKAFTSPTPPGAAAGEASCASELTQVAVKPPVPSRWGLHCWVTPFMLPGWPGKIIHYFWLHLWAKVLVLLPSIRT